MKNRYWERWDNPFNPLFCGPPEKWFVDGQINEKNRYRPMAPLIPQILALPQF